MVFRILILSLTMFSKFIHFVEGTIHSFLWPNNTLLHAYTTIFPVIKQKWIDIWECFHLSAIVNDDEHSSPSSCLTALFNSLRYILKNGIARPYDNSKFSFLRNYKTVFRCSSTILHSQQSHLRLPVSPYSCQHLSISILFFFFMTAILMCVRWHLGFDFFP